VISPTRPSTWAASVASAQGHDLDSDLGLLQPPRLHDGHVLLAGVGPDHHGLEARALALDPVPHLVLVHLDEAAHAFELGVEVGVGLGGQDDVERGAVLHEHPAVAVEDGAAGRGDGHRADPVVLGQLAEVLPAHDLQVPEVDDHQREGPDDDRLDDAEARLQAAQVLVDPHARLRTPRRKRFRRSTSS
jgi:hypothetical protein